ncbi:MAG: hypothetical protein GYA38_10345 [Chloroflexi bacterium]|nr:hypothetical protein [Chloroflexota bacterium]
MNKKSNLLYLLAGLFLVLFLTAASSTETNNNKQYCYALIAPIEEGNNGSSRIIKSDCFDNFADSISAATNGRVLLNHFARPDEVTNELLNSNNGLSSLSSQVVIGIDWDSTNFAGSSYTWVVSGSGCSISTQYSVSSMPSGWDNRVSSARAPIAIFGGIPLDSIFTTFSIGNHWLLGCLGIEVVGWRRCR